MQTKLSIAVSTLALIAALSGGAMASDIFDKGGLKDDGAVERPVSWTGVYIGVQGGYGNANHNLTVQEYSDTHAARCLGGGTVNVAGNGCEPSTTPVYFQGAEDGSSENLFNLDGLNSHGFIGGVRVGADKQLGRFVFGAFGEYNFSSMETTASITGLGAASIEKNDEWSLGARAGVLLSERTLAYILAAYTQTEYEVNGISLDAKDVPEDRRKLGATFSGISVGTGIEHALTQNISVGLEYTHTFYDSENIADYYDAMCNEGLRVKDDLDEDKVMGRLTFKLNGGLLGN